jgi:glycerol-3-phosphate dehydrogenase subunit B
VFDTVTAESGLTVGEALGVAPSLPGWRLDRALLRALDHAGVDIVTGTVTGRDAVRGAISSVAVTGAAGTSEIGAAVVVLATGRFIGGGVAAATAFVETALGIDLVMDGVVSDTEPAGALALTRAARTADQPVLGIGIRTDERGCPLTARGDAVFRNVFVAGSVRAGAETASLGLGDAASDGWETGIRAAAAAGHA